MATPFHSITEEDIQAVVEVLKSDWLTTGPAIERLEEAFSQLSDAPHAVAVSSGTAALHAVMHCLDLKPDDEVIVPAITFLATANAVLYAGGVPVFVDIDPGTALIDSGDVERKITPKTRAIVAVDFAGQPCCYPRLREIADGSGLTLISDSCHALGARYQGKPVPFFTDFTTYSFHPVKHVTGGEGGMVVCRDTACNAKLRRFRNHGIDKDFREREREGSWGYSMIELGMNYRLTDIQSALCFSQLSRLQANLSERRKIASRYREIIGSSDRLRPLNTVPDTEHAFHLFVVLVDEKAVPGGRSRLFADLHAEGIPVNVHYEPIYLHPYYQERFGDRSGRCPNAEQFYRECLTLPIFPNLSEETFTVLSKILKTL